MPSKATRTCGTTTEIWYAPNVAGCGDGRYHYQPGTTRFAAAAVVAEYGGVLAANPLDALAANTRHRRRRPAPAPRQPPPRPMNCGLAASASGAAARYTYTVNPGTAWIVRQRAVNRGTEPTTPRFMLSNDSPRPPARPSSGGTISTATTWSGAIATFRTVTPTTLALSGPAAGNYTLTGATGIGAGHAPKPDSDRPGREWPGL